MPRLPTHLPLHFSLALWRETCPVAERPSRRGCCAAKPGAVYATDAFPRPWSPKGPQGEVDLPTRPGAVYATRALSWPRFSSGRRKALTDRLLCGLPRGRVRFQGDAAGTTRLPSPKSPQGAVVPATRPGAVYVREDIHSTDPQCHSDSRP